MLDPKDYACQICGFLQLSPPWGDDGNTPLFDICNCCGVEFGYENTTIQTIKQYREQWLSDKDDSQPKQ